MDYEIKKKLLIRQLKKNTLNHHMLNIFYCDDVTTVFKLIIAGFFLN